MNFPKKTIFLFAFVAFSLAGLAQQDTNYYHKYKDRLVVSLYQSIIRTDNIAIGQLFGDAANKDSTKLSYNADANLVTGVELAYDKFSVSVGYRSVPPEGATRKGKTYHSNFSASVGGNKWMLQGGYIRYKGFYDANTSFYDTSFNSTTPFYQNPKMTTEAVKFKFLYFTNHDKFSYKSAYSCAYRQLKSCASWVLVSNLYYKNMSTDSSFIPHFIRNSYGSYADWNGLNVIGASAGGGASGNLVIGKRLFLNVTFVMGFESQWRDYSYFSSPSAKRNYLSVSGDFRAALGYNGKKFFMTLSSMNDFSFYNSGQITVKSSFLSGYFSFGYRFKVKTPKIYQKFQETKVYKIL